MALTKEDLQAISEMMDKKLAGEREHTLRMIREETQAMRADIARLNHTIEPQLKLISEGIEGLHDRYRQVDRIEAKQDEHGNRIWALEQKAKLA